ncbi:MAG: hypothetical protein UR69_C0002G0246 [Candidatus Moranbacteria bacterium GW2011_GWE2_35_2-]|nr:MAG: hypothetical protein UR69_C0002G0246 [Candidatus Moranbacteria bacterium GW2011_GWE2_35_2-]KKQ06858.1 MAG: hypothetical protein US15_C0002G0011 [Candidatus Moranbacteria bacterium GW2011_GWF1_36_4]KKQ22407.1 MAG: hypothetical protein US37_C0002G0032 [Candidatus Moranbacteria bacterium GW2011_GWF2_37_11]KKQ29475.1 MAG: hypothetical protein US44_C0001G0067 [Candidatus Moranbacteria bacterium GW2011_GWD1_37_17]KKQ30656.1 MAG: hypothetical protein US47_C0002G0246 [Candidatus Moranbacteria b
MRQKQQWVNKKKDKKIRHKRSVFLRSLFYFLLISFVIISLYTLFFSGFLKITDISLRGMKDLKQEDVIFVANDYLAGNYIGIVPKNNFILVFSGVLEKKILEQFKKIRGVKIEKEFPNRLNIIVDERDSLLVWISGNDKFIIDENGKAYEKADFSSKLILENNLVSIQDQSNRPVSIGDEILNSEYINFSLNIKNRIEKETDLKIEDQYRTSSRIAEEVIIRTQEGWSIYFNSKLGLNYSIRILKTFLEKQINREQRIDLEYVDLRIEKKIYYKMKKKESENDTSEEDGNENDDMDKYKN